MTELNPAICLKIREARREAKLSQSVVAAEVGCKQSALSMFEQGDGTKLNDECIEKLAKKFNVSLTVKSEEQVAPRVTLSPSLPLGPIVRGFCPNPHCPTNEPYQIEGRSYLLPNREKADPVGGKFCAYCGEVLEKRCPNCGAPVHEGAICSLCGDPYVAV